MTLKETIRRSIQRYPTLYGTNKYARMKILNLLFFVIGNGKEWKNGELVDSYKSKSRVKWKPELRKQVIEDNNERTVHFYPFLEKMSKIFLIPNDIKPDWFFGAIEILIYATNAPLEAYLSGYQKNSNKTSQEYMEQKKASLRKLLKNLTRRLPGLCQEFYETQTITSYQPQPPCRHRWIHSFCFKCGSKKH